MRPAIRQGEAKQQRLDSENVAELRDDRDAAAFANQRRLLAERLRNARCAASPTAECGSVKYHGPL